MTDLKNAELVVFDWDNTLDDSFHALFTSWNYTLEKYGRPTWDEATAKKTIRKTAHEIMSAYFGHQWEEALRDYRAFYAENFSRPALLPKAYDLIKSLYNDGIKLAVISNKGQSILTNIVAQTDLTPYFQAIIGAQDGIKGKPEPLLMHTLLNDLNIAPDTVWYVGDAETDIQFAKNAGTHSIFVENAGFETLESIKSYAPNLAFKSTQDLLGYYLSIRD